MARKRSPIPELADRLSQFSDRGLEQLELLVKWSLWSKGDIRWLLLDYQQDLYDKWYEHDDGIVVSNVSRQAGKSFTWLLIAVEKCLRADMEDKPISVLFCAPGKAQAMDIFDNAVDKLMATCPPWLRPKVDRNKKMIKFHGGSTIKIIGTDDKNLRRRTRGISAHFVVLDEAGFMLDLEDFLKSVILPMFNKTRNGNPCIAISSTPPEEHDHYFIYLANEAKRTQRYFMLRADEIFSAEQFEKIKQNYHVRTPDGEIIKDATEDPKFRREYLCEFSALTDKLVLKDWPLVKKYSVVTPVEYGEFEAKRAAKKFGFIPERYRMPQDFEPYVMFDYGYFDHSGVLFGFVDYELGWLIIQDELFFKEKTAPEAADLIIKKCRTLWPHKDIAEDIKYYCDPGVQSEDRIVQIRKDTGIRFMRANTRGKSDVKGNLGQISRFINLISAGKVRIFDHCQFTINTFDKAQWVFTRAGKRQDDFIRTDELGHCDLLASAILLNSTVKWKKVPLPNSGNPMMTSTFNTGANEWLKLKRK